MNRHIHLGDLIEMLADATPDRRALVTAEAERTYAELDERATRFANHLSANGVNAGDHVGIHAMNCAEWVEAFYGCFKLRAVPVNVNYRYVESELRYLYDNSDCVAVVVAPEYVDAVDAVSDALPGLRHRLVLGAEYESALAAASPERRFGERSPDDHYIVYTGGTTGMPKGVVWRQEDLVRGALNGFRMGRPIDSIDQLRDEAVAAEAPMTVMTLGPLMHGGSQWTMGNVHVVGGACVIYTERSFDPHKVLSLAASTGVNSLATIGDAMARPIAEALADPDRPDYDLSKLFALSNGGAPLSAGVRAQLHAALPNAMIVDGYGSSETGTAGIKAEAGGGEKHSSPRFNVGPDTAVLTGDLTRMAAPGETGMLARSGFIPLGYYKDPEKTARTFPTIDGKRWVVPGDFAVIEDDGMITVLGRGSGSINSGGEKIFPEEVEAALMQHPAVFDAVVVGTPSDRWGQQVTALVQLRPDHSTDLADLRRHCKTLIADYKAPKEVLFVQSVPRTPVGKIDYKAASEEALRLLGLDPS